MSQAIRSPDADAVHRVPAAVGSILTVLGLASAVLVVALVARVGTWSALAPGLLPLPWLVAGALALRARPDHPGALLFTGFGAGHLIGFALTQQLALDRSLNGWSAWSLNLAGTLCYLLGFCSLGVFLATYPTGLARGRVARGFVRVWFPLTAATAVLAQLDSAPVHLIASGVRDTMPPPSGLPLVSTTLPFVVVGPLAILIGAGLLISRGRRAVGDERRQLSYAVGAAGLLALMLVADPALTRLVPSLETPIFLAVVSVLPFVLLAGIVRFRLLDVDLYVARTLARGVVVVGVLVAFALVTLAAEGRARGLAAGLTVLAALVAPAVIRRLERWLDHRLFGSRVRGQALLRELADQLVVPSRDDQARRTAETIRLSLDASWVRIVADGLSITSGPPPTPTTGTLEVVVALTAADLGVGRLEAGPRHGGWGQAEREELTLLARHAGLALHNAALTDRLAEQVRALEASRRRIVQADLVARHRLQRDLHDGVQQQVVAMISHLGALRVLLPAGSREATVAATALEQARETLVELRQLADGVQPPVLRDQGLLAAVRSRSTRLPLPVEVRLVGAPIRWAADVEAAAYYVISESLSNVVKHAAADRAEVVVAADEAHLTVSICDNGAGMDASTGGSGLRGLSDRVEALGGRLDVETGTGGTTVTARLPIGAAR